MFRSRHNDQRAHGRKSNTTETAVVDKPAEEDERAGHHHGYAHQNCTPRETPATAGVFSCCGTCT
jgi:hypothetical protein